MDPLYASDRSKDSTVIKWATPRWYSEQYLKNLDIGYLIDVVLEAPPTYPLYQYTYAHTPTIYVVSASDATCRGLDPTYGEILSQEQMDTLYIHTTQLGLAKEMDWELDPQKMSDFKVTTTYTIRNTGSSTVTSVIIKDMMMSDTHGYNFEVDVDSVKYDSWLALPGGVKLPFAGGDTLVTDSLHRGDGNPVYSGQLPGKSTAVLKMEYRATPNRYFTGAKYKNNARITANDQRFGCAVSDTSTWPIPATVDSLKPDSSNEPDNFLVRASVANEPSDVNPIDYNGDFLPENNNVMTPIQLSAVRFEKTDPSPQYSNIAENIGIHNIIVEKLGDSTIYVSVAFNADRQFSWILSADSLATLGTSATCGIDAWPTSGLDYMIPDNAWQLVPGYKTWWKATVPVNIVSDQTYEGRTPESFYTYLHTAGTSTPRPNGLAGYVQVSLVNDTVQTMIIDDDARPIIDMLAVSPDSIKEGTIIDPMELTGFGWTPVYYKIKLSNPTFETVTTDWRTVGDGKESNPLPAHEVIAATPVEFVAQHLMRPSAASGVAGECPIDVGGVLYHDTVKYITVRVIADDIPEKTVQAPTAQIVSASLVNATRGELYSPETWVVDDDIAIDTVRLRTLICKGDGSGEIIIKARGGETGASGRYHYEWTGPNGYTKSQFEAGDAVISGLAAGNYTVVITDVWSQATDTLYIIYVAEPNVALELVENAHKNITCFEGQDGEIEITVSGGWDGADYDFVWSKEPDPTNLSPAFTDVTASGTGNEGFGKEDIENLYYGTYVIWANDSANCRVTDTIALTQPLKLNFLGASETNVICKEEANGELSIELEEGNMFPAPNDPYQIKWTYTGAYTYSPLPDWKTAAIANLYAGTYDVIAMDNGCDTIKGSYTVNEPVVKLFAVIDSAGRANCKGSATGTGIVVADGGWDPGNYEFIWDDDKTVVYPNGRRDDLYAGNYTIWVLDTADRKDRAVCKIEISPLTIVEPDDPLTSKLTAIDETYQNGNDGSILTKVTGGIPINADPVINGTPYFTGNPEYHYEWADVPSLANKDRFFLEAGLYVLTITDAWNCVLVDSAVVSEPFVIDNPPNVFTPNGDGINDIFLPNFQIKVYDRWGLLLYDGFDGWDGRYKGKLMPAGTYFYILTDEISGKTVKNTVLIQYKK
jgi:gliding motility-associated-like protein